MDGRAWKNDPDVFLLRDTNIKTSFAQRKLLAKINSIFGSLLFISDNMSEYSSGQRAVLKETFTQTDIKVDRAELISKDIMEIEYSENGRSHYLKFNVKNGQLDLPRKNEYSLFEAMDEALDSRQ